MLCLLLGGHMKKISLVCSFPVVLNEAQDNPDTGLPMLKKYETAILTFLEKGELDKAQQYATRAIQSCDRLKQLLDASFVQVTKTFLHARERMYKCMAAAGGVFVVGVGCDYLGFYSMFWGEVEKVS